MRRLALFAPLALLLFALPARAQVVSLYGTYSPNRVSGVFAENIATSPGYATTNYWANGFGAGATFNVIPAGPIKFGLDVRGASKPGGNGADLILAGPRLAFGIPFIGLKPYIQLSGGYLRTRTPVTISVSSTTLPATTTTTVSTYTQNFAAWEVIGGIDHPLAPFLDLRLIEIGGGKAAYLTSSGYPSNGNPNPSLLTISTGVVLHF